MSFGRGRQALFPTPKKEPPDVFGTLLISAPRRRQHYGGAVGGGGAVHCVGELVGA